MTKRGGKIWKLSVKVNRKKKRKERGVERLKYRKKLYNLRWLCSQSKKDSSEYLSVGLWRQPLPKCHCPIIQWKALSTANYRERRCFPKGAGNEARKKLEHPQIRVQQVILRFMFRYWSLQLDKAAGLRADDSSSLKKNFIARRQRPIVRNSTTWNTLSWINIKSCELNRAEYWSARRTGNLPKKKISKHEKKKATLTSKKKSERKVL